MDTNNKSIIQQLLEIADSVVIEPSEDLEEGKKKGKKKPYDSVTYTTGDLQKNIDHFNKCLTGKANNDNSKGPLPDYVMAKGADGSSSIPSSAATSGAGATAGASAGGEGGGMGESLEINEAKRYVRRYYMRPQDIFCSNKAEILKALIDHQDENCVIYTLNNLGDNKDVHKLTEADIIYFYEDGILYDKNHVRIMDYDLYIKHEEERDNINPETTSDAKFQDVYDDRMTDQTVVEELTEAADFASVETKQKFNLTWVDRLNKDFKETPVDFKLYLIQGKRPDKNPSRNMQLHVRKFYLSQVDNEIYCYFKTSKQEFNVKLTDIIVDDTKRVKFSNNIKNAYGGYYPYAGEAYAVDQNFVQIIADYKEARTNEIRSFINKGDRINRKFTKDELEEAKAWYKDNIKSIEFVVLYPDYAVSTRDPIDPDEFDELVPGFEANYDRFRDLFPASRKIAPGKEGKTEIGKKVTVEFKFTSHEPQPYLDGYKLAGKSGHIALKTPIKNAPPIVKDMINVAKSTPEAVAHGATSINENANYINSFSLAVAILKLFKINENPDALADTTPTSTTTTSAAPTATTAANSDDVNLDDVFDLKFESVDIHGFKLREAKEDTCVICGEPIQGYGNNAEPYKSGRCCDACNLKFVIPARIVQLEKDKE